MYAYYLVKGHSKTELENLTENERAFYLAGMELCEKRRLQELQAILGKQ